MKHLSRVICLIYCLASFVSQNNGQSCDLDVSPGYPDAKFDAIFTQNGPGTGLEPLGAPGWTGGDSTYSVPLPGGDSAFFFSDSYIAEQPAISGDGAVTTSGGGLRRRQANCDPPTCDPPTALFRARNSIVVRSAATGRLKTLTGPRDEKGFSTSYFTPAGAADTKHYYWMGDSVVVQVDRRGTRKLWTFVMEFDANLKFYGSAIAQLSLPDLQIESIRPLGGALQSSVTWGAALMLEGSYGKYKLFIYGIQSDKQVDGKVPYLARVNPGIGYKEVAETKNWRVWNGRAWVPGISNAVQLIGSAHDPQNAGDQISDEFSVKQIRTANGTAYVLVGMDTTAPFGSWRDITLYSSCRPQGPFSAKKVVYNTPETTILKLPGMIGAQSLAGHLVVYNPHLHSQFDSAGGLLISYNMNVSKNEDLLFADTYRPRFIRVRVKGERSKASSTPKPLRQKL